MKEIFLSLKNNLSNLFSLIGILLTIYFSVYYVPQYSEEIRLKKIEATNNSLVSIVQELVYNDHTIDEQDLKTMIKGKEIKDNISYPYTIDELLIQTQEKFLDNKFIPLEQRKSLVEKIDSIRDKITAPEFKEENTTITKTGFYEYLIAILGLIFSMFGLISTWAKAKKQKEYELEDKIEETKESLKRQVTERVFLESEVLSAIKEVVPISSVKHADRDTGVDFVIRTGTNTRLGVEVKYTETDLIPIRTISHLISIARHIRIPILLITNAPLTKNANQKLEDYNKAFPETKIDVLTIKNSSEIKDGIKKYINTIV